MRRANSQEEEVRPVSPLNSNQSKESQLNALQESESGGVANTLKSAIGTGGPGKEFIKIIREYSLICMNYGPTYVFDVLETLSTKDV